MKNKLIETRLWALMERPVADGSSPILSVGGVDGVLVSMRKLMEMMGVENNQNNRTMLGDELSEICHRTGKSISIRDW